MAKVGECERVDRVDGGVAFGVLGPGSHRRHDHSGGDLVGDPGLSDELAAVVEHADILAIGDATLRGVVRVDGHRLLALDAALGGLVAGAGVEVGVGFGRDEVQPVSRIGRLAGRHVVRQGIDRAAGLVFVGALPEQREHEVAGLLGDRGAELDLARRGREVAFGVRGVLVGGGAV